MRAERRQSLLVAALVATAGLGATAAPVPAEVASLLTPTQQQAPREYVGARPAKKTAKPTSVNRLKPRSSKWDSRTARRELLMLMAERANTGRQWVRVRRMLRRGPASDVLQYPAWQLYDLYAAGVRIRVIRARA
jgi:hypothetical protein